MNDSVKLLVDALLAWLDTEALREASSKSGDTAAYANRLAEAKELTRIALGKRYGDKDFRTDN
jgi:hypothetical protein